MATVLPMIRCPPTDPWKAMSFLVSGVTNDQDTLSGGGEIWCYSLLSQGDRCYYFDRSPPLISNQGPRST